MTQHAASPYYLADPYREITYLEVPPVTTVVQTVTDSPMDALAEVFDSTFSALFPALSTHGLQPIGPAFSLNTRMPSDTVDMEVGLPVDRPLEERVTAGSGITLESSELPGGRIAIVSHLGAYDGLGDAWGAFMQAVAEAGHQPTLPFWEIYVTEPSPDQDPAAMRTDLVTLLS
ncbi:AraC family transcriptional regulator [Cellulosimicrobium funkei]|nr:AraC family transcriptional regulator [Cellulosimicrobium funkei]